MYDEKIIKIIYVDILKHRIDPKYQQATIQELVNEKQNMIFLDNHSTTKCDLRVLKEMLPYFSEKYGNPSSSHVMGEDLIPDIELARNSIASLINADPENIYFTNSASEANNIVLKGIWFKNIKKHKPNELSFISSKIEHSSVLKCIQSLATGNYTKCKVNYVNVCSNGNLKLDDLEILLKKSNYSIVSLMAANNEIGTINDIKYIGEICKANQAFYHCDAVQALGKVPIDVQKMDIDALTISSHKIYGPKGIGALYLKNDKMIEPLIDGGYQNTFSSGTLNVPAIIGFGKACEILQEESKEENKRIKKLRDYLLKLLKKNIPDLHINGTMLNRLPNNLNISIPRVLTEAFIMGIDDVMISGGSACSSGEFEPSHVLKEIKVKYPDCAIRFGLGRWTTKKEIDYAVDKIVEIAESIRSKE